jgi:GT2 family glycosyltransferase
VAPALTVLVVTHNRPAALATLLQGLAGQAPGCPFDTVVSDDGSCPPASTASWPSVRVVRGPNRGPAEARNRALPLVRTPLLLLLNDDVEVEPDLVTAHVALQQRQRAPTAVMGTFEFPPTLRADLFHRVVEDLGLLGTRCMQSGVPLAPFHFWTGNLCLPTRDLVAVGGFDPVFTEPKGEDVDVGYRLARERGLGLVFSHRPRAWHVHRHSVRAWWRRCAMIGRALRLVAGRHRDVRLWPGGVMEDGSGKPTRMARARLRAQAGLAREMMALTAQVARGSRTGPIGVPGVPTTMCLPDDAEVVLRAVVSAATPYVIESAFWQGKLPA